MWRHLGSTALAIFSLGAAFAVVVAFLSVQATHKEAALQSVGRLGLDAVVYFERPVGDGALAGVAAAGPLHVEPILPRMVVLRTDTVRMAWPVTGIAPDSWVRQLPIARGRRLADPGAPDLLVDEWFARELNLDVGDAVTLFPHWNAPEGVEARIVGVLGGATLGLAFLPLEVARGLHDLPGEYTAAHVASPLPPDVLGETLLSQPGTEAVISLTTARHWVLEAMATFDLVLRSQIVAAIGLALVFLGVLAALDLAARGAEIAVLRALGWTNRSLFGLLATEVTARGLLATGVTVPLSLGLAAWLVRRIEVANAYRLDLVVPVWAYIAIAAACLLVLPLGAWPAWRVARNVTPGRALRELTRE